MGCGFVNIFWVLWLVMKKVLFRADANKSIGIGDLMSLVHLSHYFEADSWECFFMVKNYPAAIRLAEKYRVKNLIVIDQQTRIPAEVEMINKVAGELGVDLLFFELTENKLSDYVGLTPHLKKACVSFDGSILPDLHLVIDWDVAAHDFFQAELFEKTRFFLGPEYVILPFNFEYGRIRSRKYNSTPEKLLVCMGGSDEFNFTQKLIKVLIKHNVKMKLNIIVGAGYEYTSALTESLDGQRIDFVIKQNITDMFEEYIDCDVAVGAGGLTASELVATRTPAVLIATYEHQIARCRYFSEKGWVTFLGFRTVNEEMLLRSLLASPPKPHDADMKIFDTYKIVEACNEIFSTP